MYECGEGAGFPSNSRGLCNGVSTGRLGFIHFTNKILLRLENKYKLRTKLASTNSAYILGLLIQN
jgi:hypothetical protein